MYKKIHLWKMLEIVLHGFLISKSTDPCKTWSEVVEAALDLRYLALAVLDKETL